MRTRVGSADTINNTEMSQIMIDLSTLSVDTFAMSNCKLEPAMDLGLMMTDGGFKRGVAARPKTRPIELKPTRGSSTVKTDSCYLHRVLDRQHLTNVVREACDLLKPLSHTFDAIAVRGFSGAIVGSAVAAAMQKHLTIVRKREENHDCHSYKKVEGVPDQRYIVVDDQVASGATVNAIIDEIKTWSPRSKLSGLYMYNTAYYPEGMFPDDAWYVLGQTRQYMNIPRL